MKFICLALLKDINNIKRLLFSILLITFIFVSSIHAATYNYYFANSGGGSTCSINSPCATLKVAQNKINTAGSSDTVNLYFNRGDTWSMNTAAVSKTSIYGLYVSSSSPIVNIDAFGSGDKPIFDGMVTDFSSVPSHDDTNGPLRWNRIFQIVKDNCSIKNIKINGVYGMGIWIGANTDYGDYFTLESCDLTNIGTIPVASGLYHTQYTTITKNLIHTANQLSRFLKDGSASGNCNWSGAIVFEASGASHRSNVGNTISYNVLYDNYGEGIVATGTTIEYNIIGDTASHSIFVNPKNHNVTDDTIIRYNLLVQSSGTDYDNIPKLSCSTGSNCEGIIVGDDNAIGTNSAGVEVYGNTIINKYHGLAFANYVTSDSKWDFIRFYNNTIIDSEVYNLYLENYNMVASGQGFIANNASILYDRTSSTHAIDIGEPADLSKYWIIDNNAFWTDGGSPTVDSDWKSNYVTGDPKLAGEEQGSPVAWTGQSRSTYYKDFTFYDVTPNSDSALINAGKTLGAGYETKFLTHGTDFSKLPNIPTFQRASQPNSAKWSIGAIVIFGTPISEHTMSAPSGLIIEPLQ